MSKPGKQHTLQIAYYLLVLVYEPEDGIYILLRNIDNFFSDATRHVIPEERIVHIHQNENHKFPSNMKL
jgi:hypothetical protein